jgi:IS1 family transposase
MIEVLALDDSPTRSPIYFPRGPQLEGSDEIFDMLARAFFRRADQPIRQHARGETGTLTAEPANSGLFGTPQIPCTGMVRYAWRPSSALGFSALDAVRARVLSGESKQHPPLATIAPSSTTARWLAFASAGSSWMSCGPSSAKKQRRTERHEFAKGDQYTYIALASSAKAILSYRTGKRDSENTDLFVRDLRERVLGAPEFSTDGFSPYQNAIRDAFGNRIAHGVITKTYSVTHLTKEAAGRYSPAAVIAVSRDVVSGIPAEISTSYVERQNLSVRMSSRRFTRLTNGFSKKLENHAAAVSLYVTHYNMCRVHEALRTTPAVALGITERVWTVGDLIDAALATLPVEPVTTAPDRRRRFQVIEGGKA